MRNSIVKSMSKRPRRNSQGASIFLILLIAVILAYLAYLGFQYMMLTGGSREVRNAVDASVLNVAKSVVVLKVPAPPQFRDCADSSGTVGISTINRVWGKAYLINANVEEMKNTGQITGKASGNGDLAYGLAQRTNAALYSRLTNKVALDQFFGNLADRREAFMLGRGTVVQHDQESYYPTAMVDRGAEANLAYNPVQIPRNVQIKGLQYGKQFYVQGYNPFVCNSHEFCFTTFRVNEMPHLISDNYFNANRSSIGGADLAVPNAFQGQGTAYGAQGAIGSVASAVANPMRVYQMTIPLSFVTINFGNMCNVYVEGKPFKKNMPYGYRPQPYTLAQDYKLQLGQDQGKFLNGWASLGNEFAAANIYTVINLLPGNHLPALQKLLQRIQEIDPNYTLPQLIGLLQKQTPDPNQSTYYIFPRYSTPDYTNPVIDMAPATSQKIPQWLVQAAQAEGSPPAMVVKENLVRDQPNTAWDYVYPGNPPTLPHHTEISGTLTWVPGTGMDQCLGQLYVNRLTEVFFAEQPGAGGGGGAGGGAAGGGGRGAGLGGG